MNIEEQPIDNDWNVHLEIGITDVRTLHRVIDFALQNGYTKDKPEYLEEMKNQFYAMLLEYSFTHIERHE
tara:strand:- start:119 stop:328 length:210 start_codon:yes stop_codon:yes gene_type:complete